MLNRKGEVPLGLVRPSIINTSYAEPFPGWTDSTAAALGLFLLGGLGVIKFGNINIKSIGDCVPVDTVSSAIIVVTAYNISQKVMPILHVGTSDLSPITWAVMKEQILKYWNSTVSPSKIGKADIFTSTN